MKKHLVIMGVCLLFITLSLSGCELIEEEKDYITVNCTAEITTTLFDKNNKSV